MNGLKRTIKVLVFILVFSFIGQASHANKILSPDKFEYKKEIVTNLDNDYTFFIIDKDIYEYSNHNLNDLRIIDDLGANIPFMIHTKKDAKGDVHPEFIMDKIGKSTKILIKNEEIQNLELDKMIFDIDGEFERNFQIESNLIDVVDLYRIKIDNEVKEKLDVNMGNQIHTEDIIITIKNNEDNLLNIRDIKMIFNQKIIVFKPDKNRSYALYLKTDEFTGRPVYDIGIDEDEVANTKMDMSNLRKLTKIQDEITHESPDIKDEIQSEYEINMVIPLGIVILALLLVWFIIEIRKKS